MSAEPSLSRSLPRWTKTLISFLNDSHRHGEQLTLGIPGVTGAADRWLRARLAWWPRGIPQRRRVALVSSRLGRALDERPAWFAALRAACENLDQEREMLVIAPSTATARFVQRCAKLLDLPLLRVEVPRNDAIPIGRWFRNIQRVGDQTCDDTAHVVWLSPPILDGHENSDLASSLRKAPLRDRTLVVLADRLEVLHMRRGGYLEHLIESRLADAAWPPASVRLALGPTLVSTTLADRFLQRGAIGWNAPVERESPCITSALTGPSEYEQAPLGRIVPMPTPEDWAYLTHCTRRQHGPWPDQTEDEYLDELILDRAGSDRSAFGAMERIVCKRRLVASRLAIRGGACVVSFTEVPLAELCRLRVFRPHRGRWDFEPYGICIQRAWLQQSGARAVRYGDQQLWESLPAQERPFFQMPGTRRARQAIDWTVEREWRHVGDVALADLPHDAGFLFVASEAEAQRLARISPWPVTVVNPTFVVDRVH